MRRVSREVLGTRSPQSVFAVEVSGECLAARKIHSGDTVFCQRMTRQPRNGEVAVIRLHDEVTMKVWHRDGNTITLRDGDGRIVRTLSTLDDFEVEGIAFYRQGPLEETSL